MAVTVGATVGAGNGQQCSLERACVQMGDRLKLIKRAQLHLIQDASMQEESAHSDALSKGSGTGVLAPQALLENGPDHPKRNQKQSDGEKKAAASKVENMVPSLEQILRNLGMTPDKHTTPSRQPLIAPALLSSASSRERRSSASVQQKRVDSTSTLDGSMELSGVELNVIDFNVDKSHDSCTLPSKKPPNASQSRWSIAAFSAVAPLITTLPSSAAASAHPRDRRSTVETAGVSPSALASESAASWQVCLSVCRCNVSCMHRHV